MISLDIHCERTTCFWTAHCRKCVAVFAQVGVVIRLTFPEHSTCSDFSAVRLRNPSWRAQHQRWGRYEPTLSSQHRHWCSIRCFVPCCRLSSLLNHAVPLQRLFRCEPRKYATTTTTATIVTDNQHKREKVSKCIRNRGRTRDLVACSDAAVHRRAALSLQGTSKTGSRS